MTDITQLARDAGAFQYIYEGGFTEYRATPSQLAKLEQLLRDKFIAELGEPVAWMNADDDVISSSRKNFLTHNRCGEEYDNALFALKDE